MQEERRIEKHVLVAWSLGCLTLELSRRNREVTLSLISLRVCTQAVTLYAKVLFHPSPSSAHGKQRDRASAVDSVTIENPFLLKKFSVDFLSPEYMSWGSIKEVELELASWGLTKDVELVPCFVTSPHKTLMGSNSVITLKKDNCSNL